MPFLFAKVGMRACLLGSFLALSILGCADRGELANERVSAASSRPAAGPFMPRCDDICELRARALGGDVIASEELMRRHKVMGDAEREYWSRVHAENGDAVAQYNYAVELSIQSKSWLDCERAKYWLKKAAGANNAIADRATSLLGEIAVFESKLQKTDHAYCQKLFTQPPT